MKESLKRILGMAPVVEAEAAAQTNEAVSAVQAAFDAYKVETAEVLALMEGQLKESNASLATALTAVEALTAEVAELKTASEAAAALAANKRLDARKAALVATIGSVRADAMLAVVEKFDDAAFEAIVTALKVNGEVEDKSTMFTEVGATAGATDVTKVESSGEETAEMKLLRKKYQKPSKA
jgi:aspartyl/asparaginyl-tRNA synthetase